MQIKCQAEFEMKMVSLCFSHQIQNQIGKCVVYVCVCVHICQKAQEVGFNRVK